MWRGVVGVTGESWSPTFSEIVLCHGRFLGNLLWCHSPRYPIFSLTAALPESRRDHCTRTSLSMYWCEFCKFFWSNYSAEHPWTATLEVILIFRRPIHRRCFIKKSCSNKFRKIYWKASVSESLFRRLGFFLIIFCHC